MISKKYKTSEVAHVLGVSIGTVHNWIKKGLMPAWHSPGRIRLVSHDDLMAFIKEYKYPPEDLPKAFRNGAGGSK